MQQVKYFFLPFIKIVLLNISSFVFGFSVVVNDLQNNALSIDYQKKGSDNLDTDYFHQVCLEQLKKMSQIYGAVAIDTFPKSKQFQADYILIVQIDKEPRGWNIDYSLQSSWVEGEQGRVYQETYQGLSESHLVHTTKRVFDEVIRKFFDEPGLFEYPLAFVEKSDKVYKIVLSEPLFEVEKVVYETEHPITELLWDKSGESIYFTQVTDRGIALKNLDLETKHIKDFYKSSLISSPVLSEDGDFLFFIASFSNLPHLYQINLKNHHLKAMTSGPLWVSEVSLIPNTQEFLLTSNRSGVPQVYSFAPLKNSYQRMTFLKSFAGNGLLNKNSDLFYLSIDKEQYMSLFSKNKQKINPQQLTSRLNVNKISLAYNPSILGVSVMQGGDKQAVGILSTKTANKNIPLSKKNRSSIVFANVPAIDLLL